ncbi:PIN domain-containing protein [Pyrobaculum aerophilum]|uniref:PIN domain-containing protein n=1 Tax=Pyrobaculum aerophilum TaxID=13773 RepID=UPI0023F1EDF0|nr:PIN domain-containing protein [Pyrobaculum aerophilum]MCX8137562.1 PIN domain-containing protein [Pyrobaculum aerophilum]
MSSGLKILLDTTYLLPVVGIHVEGIEEVIKALSRLWKRGSAQFYYTQYNIIELLGKLSKLNYDVVTVSRGLRLIKDEFRLVHPTVGGYIKALELKQKGFRDLIDLLLYATAVTRSLKFLTRDDELVQFLISHGEPAENILREHELLKY